MDGSGYDPPKFTKCQPSTIHYTLLTMNEWIGGRDSIRIACWILFDLIGGLIKRANGWMDGRITTTIGEAKRKSGRLMLVCAQCKNIKPILFVVVVVCVSYSGRGDGSMGKKNKIIL